MLKPTGGIRSSTARIQYISDLYIYVPPVAQRQADPVKVRVHMTVKRRRNSFMAQSNSAVGFSVSPSDLLLSLQLSAVGI